MARLPVRASGLVDLLSYLSLALIDQRPLPTGLTPIRIDRVAGQKPSYYSGKHRRHGVNVQVIAGPAGPPSGPRRRCPVPPTI